MLASKFWLELTKEQSEVAFIVPVYPIALRVVTQQIAIYCATREE